MTRPTPKPIEWRVGYEGTLFVSMDSAELDGRYTLRKTHRIYSGLDNYELIDKARPTPSYISAYDTARELLEYVWYYNHRSPGLLAALASITSNEDWEKLDAKV